MIDIIIRVVNEDVEALKRTISSICVQQEAPEIFIHINKEIDNGIIEYFSKFIKIEINLSDMSLLTGKYRVYLNSGDVFIGPNCLSELVKNKEKEARGEKYEILDENNEFKILYKNKNVLKNLLMKHKNIFKNTKRNTQKIDIIITAYNAHKTIIKTLLSIEMQTLKNLVKVYIIDDQSEKDYNYLLELFKNELDITVIRNEKNLGPGASRQKGLDLSKNDYIVFIDSDDVLFDIYALESLYKNIGKKDLIIGAILEEKPKDVFTYIDVFKGCLHGKMYKRSVIDNYSIKFCDVRNHEDNTFNYLYMNCCNHIAQTEKIIYQYNYNSNSITKGHTDAYQNLKNYIYAYTWLVDECIKRNIDSINVAGFIYHAILYGYAAYVYNEDNIDVEFVLNDLSKLKKRYMEYDILSKQYKAGLLIDFIYGKKTPKITVDEFIQRIAD